MRKSKDSSANRGAGPYSGEDAWCVAAVDVIDDVAVVTVKGALTVGALAVCRGAVDQALVVRPHAVILDLHAVGRADSAVPVLGLIRRYIHRHGIPLWLADTPTTVVEALTTHGVVELYRAASSVTAALEAASP
jgi:hypothetical protein